MSQDKDMMPVNAVAQQLGKTRRWVYKLLKRGDLTGENPGQRQTRIFRESVEALKKKRLPLIFRR